MKKIMFAFVAALVLTACGSGATQTNTTTDSTKKDSVRTSSGGGGGVTPKTEQHIK